MNFLSGAVLAQYCALIISSPNQILNHEQNIHPPPPALRVSRRFAQSMLLCAALLLTGLTALRAQYVTNTYSQNPFYTMPSKWGQPGTVEDLITNCDMLEDPSGDLLAVAWSLENRRSGWPGTNMCKFMVEDWMGNQVITDINSGGMSGATQMDIVLANAPDDQGGAPGYQALVVFVVPTVVTPAPPPGTPMMGTAYLQIYDIQNAGTASITCSLRTQKTLTGKCNGFPRIDMWSDANNLTNGFPTMSEFAIVWAEGVNGALQAWFGRVNSPGIAPTPIPSLSSQYTNVLMPDVACVTNTDRTTGVVSQQIELAYSDGVNDLTYHPNSGTKVIHTEYDLAGSGSVTAGPTTLATFSGGSSSSVFDPRIEAMSQYEHTGSGQQDIKWQIAVTDFTTVDGYNSLSSGDLASPSAVTYSGPFATALAGANGIQAPCVAAGVGPSVNTTSIGNRQYTVGYYPWGTSWNYSRDISRVSGTLMSTLPYVINDSSQHVNYHWDANQSLALSNCSNSGHNLLAAWGDTLSIVYKHSLSNGGTVWRQAQTTGVIPISGNGSALYPNPAQSYICLSGKSAWLDYAISDVTGKSLQAGTTTGGARIDIVGLPAGLYVVRITGQADGTVATYKFTKQ